MGQPHSGAGGLGWLLDDLVQRISFVRHTVLLSVDGLLMAADKGLSREDAEHLAAVAAGFQGLARGAGRRFGGGAVRQTVIEMESAFLLVSSAGSGACLALLCDPDADLGLVAYEMAMLVARFNQSLSSPQRPVAVPTDA
jgi:predicted regulator of Ras-like GTPase activity (Roadblock/LC7/MglB family)